MLDDRHQLQDGMLSGDGLLCTLERRCVDGFGPLDQGCEVVDT